MWIWRGSLLSGTRAVARGARCLESDQEGNPDQGETGAHDQRRPQSRRDQPEDRHRSTEATRRPSRLCDVGHRAWRRADFAYPARMSKRRLDTLLAERGLYQSRSRAAAAGMVGPGPGPEG